LKRSRFAICDRLSAKGSNYAKQPKQTPDDPADSFFFTFLAVEEIGGGARFFEVEQRAAIRSHPFHSPLHFDRQSAQPKTRLCSKKPFVSTALFYFRATLINFFMAMHTTLIPETIRSQKSALLADWVREQVSLPTMRSDLVSESELRAESSQFIEHLDSALKAGGSSDPESPAFEPLREMLSSLSQTRNKQGFSPSETATFVLSFKRPLFVALQTAHGANATACFDDTWLATQLLDKLALHTTEAFQKAREEVIRRQQEDMIEISTPVVQLWEGVVAVPLIGTLDSNRTNLVMEALLTAIVETRSEIAIIDITGVPTVDTLVAQHLLKTVAATRLMGADCIISGIRPQIAQTMVHLQIDLSAVTTKATLAEALLVALRRTGYSVSKGAPQARK